MQAVLVGPKKEALRIEEVLSHVLTSGVVDSGAIQSSKVWTAIDKIYATMLCIEATLQERMCA